MKRNLWTAFLLIWIVFVSGCIGNVEQKEIDFMVKVLEFTNNEGLVNTIYISSPLEERISFEREDNTRNMYLIESSVYEGWITMNNASKEFNLENNLPNHSKVIKDERMKIPFGEYRMITLDVDNGSAASGILGTHKLYCVEVKNKYEESYMISFTGNNNEDKTKVLLVDMIKSIEARNN